MTGAGGSTQRGMSVPTAVLTVITACLVIAAAALGATAFYKTHLASADESGSKITFALKVDKGWDQKATPIVAKLVDKRTNQPTYHVLSQTRTASKSTINVKPATYIITFINSVNPDGALYRGPDGEQQVDMHSPKPVKVAADFERVEAKDVQKEQYDEVRKELTDVVDHGAITKDAGAGYIASIGNATVENAIAKAQAAGMRILKGTIYPANNHADLDAAMRGHDTGFYPPHQMYGGVWDYSSDGYKTPPILVFDEPITITAPTVADGELLTYSIGWCGAYELEQYVGKHVVVAFDPKNVEWPSQASVYSLTYPVYEVLSVE